ncbi:MAG: Signal peptidase I P [candidate division WS6 bacterium OLB20]|uniref:Signal peptidase I n=1 Tax=candidate division WS6 bacterium OLB20 TaxID=1617426 RepID=A0A136LW07_9BACT|nr:MAG: Signal peptidase I P [candidate division WS6 bacterium OLB20]
MLGPQPTVNPSFYKPEDKIRAFFVDIVQTVIIALLISVFIYMLIAIPNQVDGQSMEPNFQDQELLLTNKVIEWFGGSQVANTLGVDYNYRRGDVVIFNNKGTDLIKRIIAVGGDTIRIEDNGVFVNGSELDEKYIPKTTRTRVPFQGQAFMEEGEELVVPEGHYFLMGDNRENSKDSRFAEVGFVPRSMLKGRVFFRYWPVAKFGIIRQGEYEELSSRE